MSNDLWGAAVIVAIILVATILYVRGQNKYLNEIDERMRAIEERRL